MARHRLFIRKNITSVSIFLFVLIFAFVYHLKPGFLFDENGSIRDFGLGYKKKTIIPVWFVTFILAIFSYLFVLYYLAVPKFNY
ncbi:MAG: hypothetical protein CML42_08025 [Rhodobacteraceae bacterium]|nr:hypothetical protein [Paracoccaceae bacterium]|tara:strand:+ start:432 stop:683 length:252 start_codon:yes stop_codon:yes gene_type:complete